MGLRKIIQKDETSYMYANVSIPDEVLVILLRKDSAFSVTLKTESDAVIKWCRNIQKSPQEYVTSLHKAVENCTVTYDDNEQKDKQEDVFEIQEEYLVWKQYFPDKNVYGRRGKFTLEKISYDEAVKEVLNGTIGDLNAKSSCIQKLTEDLGTQSKELQETKILTAKCVKEKEEFEKEIYGKCVSLINTKKLRIRQLMSSQPSTSGEKSNVVKRILTDTQSMSTSKSPKSSNPDSDGYSSDTDVDDPGEEDIDTDEENLRKASAQKEKRNNTGINSKSKAPKPIFDSQDDLFNDSLEAELYPTDMVNKKRKLMNVSSDKSSEKSSESKSKSKASDGRKKDSKSEERFSSHSNESDVQKSMIDEISQNSILNELF